jgi:3D-(3,5/4)-trihydroxycyclohexane-1,2-dione acylhydrolase (decyclizing)
MKTIRLTAAEAIVRWLIAQRTTIDGEEQPLFPGVFAIFGHGNVTSLGHALQRAGDELPTWRGQNEQGMALAAVGFTKARRRRQIMVATSSIGPGATNMVTAAGVASANRLPLLLLAGDTFTSRGPDPVLQQVEHFGDPSTTVNDAFRPVVRYWDRITRPVQLLGSMPQALATMLDPADCGPVLLALPQDVQAEAFDVPTGFLEPVLHQPVRPRADRGQLERAAELLRAAEAPLVVAGGGVHHSGATMELAAFAAAHGIPVVETMAGRAALRWEHHCYAGPLGVTGSDNANRLAAQADVVLAVGTRLADFTTGSWSVFAHDEVRLIGLNAARFDAGKHHAHPVVGDAREALVELDVLLRSWTAPSSWLETARGEVAGFLRDLDARTQPPTEDDDLPTYAQVVGAVNRQATADDYVVAAAGGLPGELNANWATRAVGDFDCEYGFSCMGYEISGAWGARMARPHGEVFAFVGDGSYLMMNSDLYSSVLSGHKLIVILCDNGGFAVIDRLQRAQGGESFNNQLDDCRTVTPTRVDFVAHARALGCAAVRVATIADLDEALVRARAATTTSVIVIATDPDAWTEGGAFWEVGVPEVSETGAVRAAREAMVEAKLAQRTGW